MYPECCSGGGTGMELKHIHTPLTKEVIRSLSAGEPVLLTGTVYTARDAAHARLAELMSRNKPLPMDLDGQIIYYAGPAPTPPGKVIGSVGPTTSGRMDPYTPDLIRAGLGGMIGKGKRSHQVREACREYTAVYFAAPGGVAALMARSVRSMELIAWPELGPEAIYRLEVTDFPLIVINDCRGRDYYREREQKNQ